MTAVRRSPLAPIALPLALLGYGGIGLGFYLSVQQSDSYRHTAEIPTPVVIFVAGFYIAAAGIMCGEEVVYGRKRDATGRVLHILFLVTNFFALGNVVNAMNIFREPAELRDMSPFYTSLWLFGATFVIAFIATYVSGFTPALKFSFNYRENRST